VVERRCREGLRFVILQVTHDLGPSAWRLGVPGGVPVAVVLVALALVAWALGWRELRGSGRVGVLLGASRALSLLAVLALALSPRLTATRFEARPGSRVLLFDLSRSMSVEGAHGRRSVRVRRLAERWSEDAASEGALVLGVDRSTHAVELSQLASEVPAVGAESRIRQALEAVLEDDVDGEVGAIVLVSDGAGEASDGLDELDLRGHRVHTIAVGGDDALVDDALARVRADPVGFLRQSGTVRVTVRSSHGGPVAVALRSGEELVDEEVVEVPPEGSASVDLRFTPRTLGRSIYRVSIPLQAGDTIPENNERPFLVRVERDRLRVLLVAGRPSWDERFLRAFLKGDSGIDLVSFFILRSTEDESLASPEEMALIPFPTEELFREHLSSFDVVFLQNFDYAPYGMQTYLPRLRDYVRGGGALAMVGGDQSFASAGYGETPLAEVLPTTLPRADAPESQRVVLGEFHPAVVYGMRHHPLLDLAGDPAESAERWAALAPLQGANVLGLARGDAQVLMRHPSHREAGGALSPVLVVGRAGAGRVLELGSDSSYRWGFVSGGVTGDASAHERFWDHALRWLAKDPRLEPCQLATDRERYASGAVVAVSGRIADARYVPLEQVSVRVLVTDLTGAIVHEESTLTDGEGSVSLSLAAPTRPGGYLLRVSLADSTAVLAEEAFVVESGGRELARPQAQLEALRALAERSGGRHFDSPEDAPSLPSLDASRTRIEGVSERAVLDTWWAFAFTIGLLGADWVLRRRFGRR